jgi:hypothetical protein
MNNHAQEQEGISEQDAIELIMMRENGVPPRPHSKMLDGRSDGGRDDDGMYVDDDRDAGDDEYEYDQDSARQNYRGYTEGDDGTRPESRRRGYDGHGSDSDSGSYSENSDEGEYSENAGEGSSSYVSSSRGGAGDSARGMSSDRQTDGQADRREDSESALRGSSDGVVKNAKPGPPRVFCG